MTTTETETQPFSVLLSQQGDLAKNCGANITRPRQQSAIKYKHGRGHNALNLSLFRRTHEAEEKEQHRL